MEFDTFYQYFIYSKNWAYISIILILPIFAVLWNTLIYPTKDEDILKIMNSVKSRLGCGKKQETEE